MTIKFALTADDLLEYQLYFVSNNKSLKIRKNIVHWGIGCLYVIIGTFFTFSGEPGKFGTVDIFFAVFGVIWLIFYPAYRRWRFKRYYKKQVLENYSNKIGRVTELTIHDDHIYSNDGMVELKTKYDEIENLIELKNHVLIKFKGPSAFIISKDNIYDLDEMKRLLQSKKVSSIDDTKWKW